MIVIVFDWNIERSLETFEKERIRLLNNCALKDENGEIAKHDGNVTIPPENVQLWNDSLEELRNIEIEVDILSINVEDISEVKITVAEIRTIEFMLVQ